MRTSERLTERLDGALIGACCGLVLREVVDVREVDDPVGRGRSASQAIKIIERTALHLCAGGGK
jgi:hypothetical protein